MDASDVRHAYTGREKLSSDTEKIIFESHTGPRHSLRCTRWTDLGVLELEWDPVECSEGYRGVAASHPTTIQTGPS